MKFFIPLAFISYFSFYTPTIAQQELLKIHLESQISYNPDSIPIPFWFRSNQFGSVPIEGISANFIGSIQKKYRTENIEKQKLLDWGGSFEGRANFGRRNQFLIIEAYIKAKIGIFELKSGRVKEVQGLMDSTLSMGSFSLSGNALGIPKVEIRIDEYWPKNSLVSIKGHFGHGWYGNIPTVATHSLVDTMYTYFHQKSFWFRLARSHWKLKLYGGFSDNAYWGDEYRMSTSFTMTKPQRYWSVISGKKWNGSKVGNHLGSFDGRAEYSSNNHMFTAYHQFFYEVGALWHFANIADGLTGFSFEKIAASKDKKVILKKGLIEFLYTKNQAGEKWSKPTPTGNENYYNHYLYNYGWSYKSKSIGSPFITPRNTVVDETLPFKKSEFFINNRLWAVHLATLGTFDDLDFSFKASFSQNFGTRFTETIFPKSNQFSFYSEGSKLLDNKIRLGLIFAFDRGELLASSTGFIFKVARSL